MSDHRAIAELRRAAELRSTAELVVAGSLWGFGFPATIWALQALTPSAIMFYRFVGAALLGAVFVFFRPGGWRRHAPVLARQLRTTWFAGLLLALAILPQTIGLQTTTAAKSAFITILYVVFVPLKAALFLRDRQPWRIYVAIPIALGGIALIVNLELAQWTVGDTWTLVCAFFAATHILYLGRRARATEDTFFFSAGQNFWTGIFCLLPLAAGLDHGSWRLGDLTGTPLLGLLALTVGSSFIAFTLQVRAQRHLAPAVASILFLLESPFSALFAFFLLGETFSPLQVTGGLVIIFCCVLVQWPARITAGAAGTDR